jgi:hypothetical protein
MISINDIRLEKPEWKDIRLEKPLSVDGDTYYTFSWFWDSTTVLWDSVTDKFDQIIPIT